MRCAISEVAPGLGENTSAVSYKRSCNVNLWDDSGAVAVLVLTVVLLLTGSDCYYSKCLAALWDGSLQRDPTFSYFFA